MEISRNKNIHQHMKTFESFLNENEYESDALKFDIINIKQSNIAYYLNNKQIILLVNDMVIKLHSYLLHKNMRHLKKK